MCVPRISQWCILLLVLSGLALVLGPPQAGAAQADPLPAAERDLDWGKQWGTSGADSPGGVAARGQVVFVAGESAGPEAPEGHYEGRDAWVRKFDRSGHLQWQRVLHLSGDQYVKAVAASRTHVTVVGQSYSGSPTKGLRWVLDARTGATVHQDEFIGPDSVHFFDVVMAGKSAYVVGTTAGKMLLQRYSTPTGGPAWTKQIAASVSATATGVAKKGNRLYVVGHVTGTLPGAKGGPQGGTDVVVLAASPSNGSVQWARQFGGADDDAGWDIALTPRGLAIGGQSEGLPSESTAGGWDALVAMLTRTGRVRWARLLGTSDFDVAGSVTWTPQGPALAGGTFGELGAHAQGGQDVFWAQYSPSGTLGLIEQMGTGGHDLQADLFYHRALYLSFSADGAFFGHARGGTDATVQRLVAYQPDAWIKLPGKGWRGKDRYVVRRETYRLKTKRKRTISMKVRVRNTGEVKARTWLKATCPRGLSVRWPQGRSANLKVGQKKTKRIKLVVARRAPLGKRTCRIRATMRIHGITALDTIRLRVKVRR